MTAREYLSRPRTLLQEITRKQRRILFLRRLADSTTAPLREITVQSTADPARVQAFLAEAADEEEEIRRLEAAREQALIDAALAISLLPDEKQVMLMEMKYLDGCGWAEIASQLAFCRSRTYRLHQLALEWLDNLPEIRNAE